MLLAAGGCFSPHKDLHSLTVLMPLVDSWAFEGGGTAFWASPAGAVDRELGTVPHDINTTPPTIMLAPPAGTALLFGGAVTHAGQPVTAGQRAVFVASFSGPPSDMDDSHTHAGEAQLDTGSAYWLECRLLEQMYN